MKRKLIITIERECTDSDIFAEVVKEALDQYSEYIKCSLDELDKCDYFIGESKYPLHEVGKININNGAVLDWVHTASERTGNGNYKHI